MALTSMLSVEVGLSGPVKGRLPHGWRIQAHLAAKILKITSPDTDKFLILVKTDRMEDYSAEYQKTWVKLEQDSCVDAKYDDDSGVLRFDSMTYPEFWIEVQVKKLPCNSSRKKQKTATSDRVQEEEEQDDDFVTIPWSKVEDEGVLTLWPGTPVREVDLYGPKGIPYFFKEAFDIDVTPVGCVTTLPDRDEGGVEIQGTGGRHDFFFFVKLADVPKFAVKRFQFGMRWWSDVYFNNGEDIYPSEFLKAYAIRAWAK